MLNILSTAVCCSSDKSGSYRAATLELFRRAVRLPVWIFTWTRRVLPPPLATRETAPDVARCAAIAEHGVRLMSSASIRNVTPRNVATATVCPRVVRVRNRGFFGWVR